MVCGDTHPDSRFPEDLLQATLADRVDHARRLLGSVLYNARATEIFEATATLQIGADPNVLGLDRPLIDQRDWMREFLPTQLAILESRELAGMARRGVRIADRAKGRDDGALISAEEIVGGRCVSPLSNTRLVSIGFRSDGPGDRRQVANALHARM